MDSLIRKSVRGIKPYIPGRPIDEIKRKFNLKDVIKLASNENPLSPSRGVLKAISRAARDINRYPDSNCFYLKGALSKKLGISSSKLIFGNGSDEIIDVVIKTFVNEDEEVLTADTTFLEYEIISRVNSRRIRLVPLKDYRYDLEATLKAIGPKTKLVFIANPNNPTGTYLSKNEVRDFLGSIPANVIVVFDEAYKELVDVPDFPDTISYLDTNIIILRTFSKAYSLAGLRLGYAIAKEGFIEYMERVRQPFNVNSLAQAAGLAALSDDGFINRSRRLIASGKKYIYESLDGMGIEYVKSASNFVLINLKKDGVEVSAAMMKCGMIVRDMKQYGLNNYIRMTIGKSGENKKFIKVLKKLLRQGELR